MALVPPAPEANPIPDEAVCTPEHCFHAFDALYCALTSSEPIPPQFPDEKYPLFVTWNTMPTRPGRSPRLRGCIGNFEAQPIREGLSEFALISAFNDHRFRPIGVSELSSLECCVSLLTDFEDATSYLDWTVGVHGIQISFPHPSLALTSASSSNTPSPFSSSTSLRSPRHIVSRRTLSATYLPDVMPAQGWDRIEAIDSAIQKASWDGRITEDIRRSIKLRRYQSKRCEATWEEYVEWRTRNGGDVEPL